MRYQNAGTCLKNIKLVRQRFYTELQKAEITDAGAAWATCVSERTINQWKTTTSVPASALLQLSELAPSFDMVFVLTGKRGFQNAE